MLHVGGMEMGALQQDLIRRLSAELAFCFLKWCIRRGSPVAMKKDRAGNRLD
jgi:hypothetical protein